MIKKYLWIGLSIMVIVAGAGIAGSVFLSSEQPDSLIKKPVTDNRGYQVITLENGIKTVLVSDPQTDKAAAVVNVEAGSFNDPDDRAGLAHFLEHMLFLGTEKYPDPGEYDDFIARHGGSKNAFTSGTNTVYFFDIDPDFLEPAMDRLSQFFIAPLFTEELTERERNAVDSEYKSGLLDDGRRIYDAMKMAFAEDHPAVGFQVGDLESLSMEGLREDLFEFYNNYYSANRMTLVVYGKEDLNQLRQWAEQIFNSVPNHNLPEVEPNPAFYNPEDLPSLLEIKPRRETRSLTMSFPMPPLLDTASTKPAGYLSWLIGHEGPGSLLSLLKDRGWAENLSAGAGGYSKHPTTFDIRIELTEPGYEHINDVVDLAFDKIQQVTDKGIQESIYQEVAKLSELDFLYYDKSATSREAITLSSLVRRFEPENLLFGSYEFAQFDPEQILEFAQALNPNNLALRVVAPEVTTNAQSPYYNTDYRLTKISDELITQWSNSAYTPELAVPAANPFIPQTLALEEWEKPKSDLYFYNPERIYEDQGITVWHQQDQQFSTPRTNIIVNLETDWVNKGSKNKAATEIYLQLVDDELSQISYDAYLAGLEYDLSLSDKGIYLRVFGYSDTTDKLLDVLMNELVALEIDESRFEFYRQDFIRRYRNQREDRVLSQLYRSMYELLRSPLYTYKSMIPALEKLTIQDMELVRSNISENIHVTTLIHGNIRSEQAEFLGKRIANNFSASASAPTVNKVMEIDKTTTFYNQWVDHQDSAILMYYQGEEANFRERALYALLAQVLDAPFFRVLRTEKQLGYIVHSNNLPMYQLPGVAMSIQSPNTDPALLQRHIDKFLKDFLVDLSTMDEESFEQHKNALISKLTQKPKNVAELGSRFWQDIRVKNTNFNSLQRVSLEVEKITRTGLMKFYENQILPQDARRLIVYHTGSIHRDSFEQNQRLTANQKVVKSTIAYQDNRPYKEF